MTICQTPPFRSSFDPARAYAQRAAAGLVGLDDGLAGFAEHAAGREVRPLYVVEQGLGARVRRLDQVLQRVADLRHVVRRNAGRHADRDALRTVGQQVGKGGGEHQRLLVLAIVGRAEIDGILVDPGQHQGGGIGELGLGVAHRRRAIAVDVAEIALAVDQPVALRELLRHAHHGVIDRLVAVGMVLAHDVADHARRFLGFGARPRLQVQLPHAVEQAPVHRLQPIAHVRQRARHDGGQRIGEIALAQRISEVGNANLALGRRNGCSGFGHNASESENLWINVGSGGGASSTQPATRHRSYARHGQGLGPPSTSFDGQERVVANKLVDGRAKHDHDVWSSCLPRTDPPQTASDRSPACDHSPSLRSACP